MSLDSAVVADGVSAQGSAGTPSLIREATFSAGNALEFEAVLDLVAGFAAGPLGGARVRARRPSADPGWVRAELGPLGELLDWSTRANRLDVPPVPVIAAHLERLRLEGSVLEGPELVALRSTLEAADWCRQSSIASRPTRRRWPPGRFPFHPDDLEKQLTRSLDEEGQVLDTASPALLRARSAVQEARARLIKKLEAILRGGRSAEPGARSHDAEWPVCHSGSPGCPEPSGGHRA